MTEHEKRRVAKPRAKQQPKQWPVTTPLQEAVTEQPAPVAAAPVLPMETKPAPVEVAPAVAVPLEPVLPTPVAQGKRIIKKVGGRRWWLFGVGAGIIIVGVAAFGLFLKLPSLVWLGLGSIAALGIGAFVAYRGLQVEDEGIVIREGGSRAKGKKEKKVLRANNLNIYPDRIAFEETDVQLGHPRKCRNDGKYYFVHIWDTACGELPCADGPSTGHLVSFRLPDTQYRDPREFANNLNIPAHRALKMTATTTLQKIAPIAIVFAMMVIAVLAIATTAQPVPAVTPPVVQSSTPMTRSGG